MIGRIRLGALIVATVGIFALTPAVVVGAERYVVPSGGLANGGCPPANPCTFAYAIRDRPPQPGDELILAPGTYQFTNAFPVGGVGSVQVRAADPSQRPVFALSNVSALFNAGTDVSDITFTGSPPGSDALLWTGRHTKRVEVRSSAAAINIGNSDTIFADSLAVAAAGPAIELQSGTEGTRIRGVTAIANGPGAFGIRVTADQSGMLNRSSDAHLNSVIARGPGGDLAGTVESSDDPPPTATITARRSNYRTTAGDLTFVNGGGNQTTAADTANGAVFANFAGGNYRLRAGSPAIDAGELTFDNGAFDLDAGPRTLGGAMDIGAYEAPYVPPVAEAPETDLTKAPKRKITTGKKRVRLVYRFTSPAAGATFECAFGKSGFKPCSSPFRKRVKVTKKARRHRFAVRAISSEGVLDSSPARARTKVKRKR